MSFKNLISPDTNSSDKYVAPAANETDKLIWQLNDTNRNYPSFHFLHLFNGQVERHGDNPAVAFENNSISFKELDYRSSVLAQRLMNKISGPGQIIALFFNRSVEMMISIIGIMKAGCAYLPIDPKYPAQRVAYILDDSKVENILTITDLLDKLPAGNTVKVLDYSKFGQEPMPDTKHNEKITAAKLAYVIYTSASTGNPKGVMVTHDNLANFIYAMQEIIPFSQNERLLMLAPISFDLSISETLLPLASGTTVFIAGEKEQEDPVYFNDCICRNNISMVHCTPSRLSTFLSDSGSLSWLNTIKFMMVGGEAFSDTLFRKLKDHYKGELYNLYGPTEATVWSTFKNMSDSETVNIGQPLGNNSIYILDENNRLLPIGVVGELCIGGKNVTHGYLNNKELTESKFIPDTFKNEGFIYKTGDLARWNANDEIEYYGRIDHQVKIRGYRVELKEIENTLIKYTGIASAIVAVKEASNGEKYICAYMISGDKVDFFELKSFLGTFLPDYMVPSFYFQMPKFPVTFNGKIDHKALPFVNTNGSEKAVTGSAIHSQLEIIWQDVLGIGIQSADDNFFEIGGHSLTGIILINKIWENLKVKISLSELFQYSTINLLAKHISGQDATGFIKIPVAPIKDHYVLSPAQKRMYILQFIDPKSTGYNISQFYSVTGDLNLKKLNSVFQLLVNRHESLRTRFKFIDDEVVQQVVESVDFSIEMYEIRNESEIEGCIKSFIKPFNLANECLFKVGLAKIADSNSSLLMLDMHHIITDGVSLNILINEFIDLYKEGGLQTLNIQYKDYSEWIFKHASDIYNKQEQYWLSQFADGVPLLNMTTMQARPDDLSNEGGLVNFVVDPSRVRDLKLLCDEHAVTLNMLLTAIYAYVLRKHSNQNELVIGTIISGRNYPDLEKVIGMFANFLPLKLVIEENDNFVQFLQRTKDSMIKAYENQEYPFDMLVEKLKIKRQFTRNPVFDTMLVYHSEIDFGETITLPDVTLSKYKAKSDTSLLDFKIDIFNRSDGRLDCNLFYKKMLFKESDMIDLSADILAAIDQCIKDPQFYI